MMEWNVVVPRATFENRLWICAANNSKMGGAVIAKLPIRREAPHVFAMIFHAKPQESFHVVWRVVFFVKCFLPLFSLRLFFPLRPHLLFRDQVNLRASAQYNIVQKIKIKLKMETKICDGMDRRCQCC